MRSSAFAALVAGGLGSLAMDLVQDGFAAVFERNRAPSDRDEETEAIVAVVRRILPLAGISAQPLEPGLPGRFLHYVFGCGFALAYESIRPRRPQISAGGGLFFGIGLWLLSDVILIPAAHLGRQWSRYSPAERANAVASHLAYALTTESVLHGTARR